MYVSKKGMKMKLTKILKTTILTTLIVGISVVKFYNPVFAGPEEDFNLGIRLGELIKKGERFSDDNLTVKRSGTGISPMEWDDVIGKTTDKEYQPDELVR